jgi:hypothetical protein
VFADSPEFYLSVSDDPLFMPAVLGVLFMYTVGVVTMRRMIAIKV